MSNREAVLGQRARDGTMNQVEISVETQKESEPSSESSSSSDGNNEPQSPASTLQRPQVIFGISTENLPPVSITPSQQQIAAAAANVPPNSTSAAEAETEEAEAETEASTVQTPVAAVAGGGLFQLSENSSNQNQNQLLLFPQQSLGSASAGNGSPFLPRHPPLHQLITMQQQQEPSAAFGSGSQDYRYQNMFGQGIGSTPSGGSINPFQLQNMPKRLGLSLPLQLDSMQLPTNSNTRMQLSWPDNNLSALPMPNLAPMTLHSSGQATQTQFYNPYNNTRTLRNSVYDPMYEALGLPIDPHLRMFLARRENNGDGQE